MAAFLDLLARGKINLQPLITHRFSIDQADQAYQLITGDQASAALGVVLTYPRADKVSTAEPLTWIKSKPDSSGTSPPDLGKPFNLGLVGAGNFAQGVLLPALKSLPDTQLRAVCNSSGLAARHVADKYQAAYCTSEPNDLFTDPHLDAVMIATRHDSHAGLTIQALGSGCPVFVEKPLALDLEQLQDIAAAFNQAENPLLMVGFNRRFAPMAVQMKQFLTDIQEPLAMHYQVNAGYIPLEHWVHDPAVGGGRIIGEACHFVDFLSFLTNSHPTSLHAQAIPNAGRYNNDNVVITLRFHNGAIGTLTYLANGDKAYPKEQVHVSGGGAVAFLNDFRSLELYKNGRKKTHKTHFRQEKGHRQELEAFLQAIRNHRESPIPFENLVATTLTTFRILDSLRSEQVVEIDLAELKPSDLT
jgi:predicted dehydrogenase